jgi:murein L,D-transpeptidase YcbB/YkuD
MVKSVRLERLLATTAFGLILALSSHGAPAQQADQNIETAAPASDTSSPPPQRAATDGPAGGQTDTTATVAPQQEVAAPPAEPSKDATPKADVTATAAPVTVESQVADQLRELISGKRLDQVVNRKDERAGVEQFYKDRAYKPIWTNNGVANATAKSAIAYLGQVQTVGLDPRDYPTPDFGAANASALAEAELRLTASVLAFARHAEIGRIHYTRVDADIAFKLDAPEPAAVLVQLAGAKDAAAVLDSYNPPHEEFKALKAKLAELRANGGQIVKPKEPETNPGAHVQVADGKKLKPGMKDPRVVALRKRLNVAGDKDNPLYDETLLEAVKTFQTEMDLEADGVVGANTLRALNGAKAEPRRAAANPIDTVLVNMERWRWLPRKLGNNEGTYVVVNVPDYSLSLMHAGKLFWKTKLVVGKPGKAATPMTSADMKFITVNPTWNVPPSIIENEYLPALQSDPTMLDRYGLKIYQEPDGTVRIYQPPGAGNALGRIRFNFPNQFLVYQHDTPDKYLFKRDRRAYSHGCLRVENPLDYAVKLLSIQLPEKNYTQAKLEGMFGNSEINIDLPKPIPVHLTYQSAFVDQDGKLQLREDVYGRDARMIAILKGSDRKVADIPIERPKDLSGQAVRLTPGTYGAYGEEGYAYYRAGGPDFFNMLFGGGPRYQPRPRGTVPTNNPRHFYSRR